MVISYCDLEFVNINSSFKKLEEIFHCNNQCKHIEKYGKFWKKTLHVLINLTENHQYAQIFTGFWLGYTKMKIQVTKQSWKLLINGSVG